jgi:hypothetical protein
LGKPVVPEVYWMLIGSEGYRVDIPLGDGVVRQRLTLGYQRLPVFGVEVHDTLERRTLVVRLLDYPR